MKKILLHGLVAGVLAAIAGLVYDKAYAEAFWTDFSEIINPMSLFSSMIIGTVLASAGSWLIDKIVPKYGEVIFNFIFVILTMISILGPMSATLPLTVESPEMFVGLAIPLHFFPFVFWFAVKPLFKKS